MTAEREAYKELTILLVEDDEIDAIGVQRALHKLKLLNPVVRAHDGIEGLAMLRNPESVPRPFIILLDINMPRMSGLEMLTELRNDAELSSSIVFILTTSKADEDKLAAYQLNVAGYIVKDKIGDGFLRIVGMLDNYWRVIELPAIK